MFIGPLYDSYRTPAGLYRAVCRGAGPHRHLVTYSQFPHQRGRAKACCPQWGEAASGARLTRNPEFQAWRKQHSGAADSDGCAQPGRPRAQPAVPAPWEVPFGSVLAGACISSTRPHRWCQCRACLGRLARRNSADGGTGSMSYTGRTGGMRNAGCLSSPASPARLRGSSRGSWAVARAARPPGPEPQSPAKPTPRPICPEHQKALQRGCDNHCVSRL